MREIRRILWAFAAFLGTTIGAAAQLQGGADWDATARQFSGGSDGPAAAPAAPRNTNLDELNKILSVSQLTPSSRSFYLSIRAFLLSRAGREAESRKDVAEMGKVLPNAWQVVMWSTLPGLAGDGDRAAALRTLGYGLQRKPDDPWLLVAQAQVHMQIADYAQAAGILDTALSNASGSMDRRLAVYSRGQAHFNLGNFQQAADDFDAALAGLTTVKSRLIGVLWRYAAQVHTRQDARLVLLRDVGNENLYEWPGPIAKFLLGRLPGGELEVAAESDANAKRGNGKCPAAFYIAMEAQRRGDKQRAREQLQLAQARCPTVSPYNWAASTQLKRL
jgi:tetratricopeptide (TPR) repeat protein